MAYLFELPRVKKKKLFFHSCFPLGGCFIFKCKHVTQFIGRFKIGGKKAISAYKWCHPDNKFKLYMLVG